MLLDRLAGLTIIIVILGLAAIMLRAGDAEPLDRIEWLYLVAAPIPALLALVLPGPIAELMRDRGSSRAWGQWLNVVGGSLSLALIVAGALLLGRRSTRGLPWDGRLIAGLFIAALPALLIGLVVLMYAVIGR